MKQELKRIYKNGKYEEIKIQVPDEIRTVDYEIGFCIDQEPKGAIPKSIDGYFLRAGVVLNLTSRRLNKNKRKLMSEINKKLKELGVKGDLIIFKDMWDDNTLRPKPKPDKDEYCSECGQKIDWDSIGPFKSSGGW